MREKSFSISVPFGNRGTICTLKLAMARIGSWIDQAQPKARELNLVG